MHLGTCTRQRITISNERASTNWQASYKLRSNIWRTEAHGARKSAREEESILKKLTRKQDVPPQKRKAEFHSRRVGTRGNDPAKTSPNPRPWPSLADTQRPQGTPEKRNQPTHPRKGKQRAGTRRRRTHADPPAAQAKTRTRPRGGNTHPQNTEQPPKRAPEKFQT